MQQIYLDFNATTPIAPSVVEAMHPFLVSHFGNPSSTHVAGQASHAAVEDARRQVAGLLGAMPEEIVFTSGGTEANNLALKGVLWRYAPRPPAHLVISAIEHPAISEPARFLERCGYSVSVCPCNSKGVVSADDVLPLLREDTVLVSVMHANNEVGTIEPIVDIARVCRERSILVHTDAAQTVGKIATNVDELRVDLLSIAGHKLYAPKGVGALYVRQGVDLEPLLHGAGHERGLRAGTENVAQIVGLGKAADLAARGTEHAGVPLSELRDRLQTLLKGAVGEGLTVNGDGVPRLPNTLSVNFPHVSGYDLLARVPEICASTGAACHSGAASLSPTLRAMQVPADVARGTVRLSIGWSTSLEEVERAAGMLAEAWEALQ